MKLKLSILSLILCLSFFACEKEPVVDEVVSEEIFEFSTDGPEFFSTPHPRMRYDTVQGQEQTIIYYHASNIRFELIIDGREVGTYGKSACDFLKFDGFPSLNRFLLDIQASESHGLTAEITNYGEVGEFIEGTFKAESCNCHRGRCRVPYVADGLTGSFKVLREE